MVRDGGHGDAGCLFNKEGDRDGSPAQGSPGRPRTPLPAAPSMASPWCRSPPLPIWRRAALSISRDLAPIYSALEALPPLRSEQPQP